MQSSLLIVLGLLFLLGALWLRSQRNTTSLTMKMLAILDYISYYWGWFKYCIGFGPSFILPDMISHCKYPVRLSPYCKEQSQASIQWLSELSHISKKEEARYVAAKFGTLTSLSLPFADAQRLRVAIDWMNYVFWLDDQLEVLDVEGNREFEERCMAAMRDPFQYQTDHLAGILTKSWCSRLEQASSTAFKDRFMHSMKGYLQGVRDQVDARIQNSDLDIEEYMAIRWHSSGVMPSVLLTDFCRGIYLPDYVHDNPIFDSIRHAVGDHIIYVNDIVSYDRESREDSHNLVCVVMKTKGYNIQEAMNFVGQKANECVDQFEYARSKLPSWGQEVDKLVVDCIFGYEHWISGHLHWALSSERYFGDIKKTRVVKLRRFWHPLMKYQMKQE